MYLQPPQTRATRRLAALGKYARLGIIQLPADGGIRTAPIQIVREPISRRITPPIPVESPISAPVPSSGATQAGTPVPVGFPTNQFFVSPDGSVWEYSQAQGNWINQGTPYNVGAAAPGATTTPVPADTSAATPAPINVNVAPAVPAGSSYQGVLDWLGQSTLISSIPNWVIVAGAGIVALKISREGGRR